MARLEPRRRAMRRYLPPRKVSVLATLAAVLPSTEARWALPCPAGPLPFFFPPIP